MYKPYPKYKKSGVAWLGDVPEGWEISKLKYLCRITTGNKDTENKVDNGKYPFYVRSQTVERINSYSFDGEAILTAGDGVGVGKVFHYTNGKFDFHQRVYLFYAFKKVDGKFLFEYIKNNFYKVALAGVAKSTVDSLRLPLIQNFMITVPPLKEQLKISNYLTQKTKKIDTLIKKQQTLIELLKEKRQALISHVVTKGLDDSVVMKDSGVAWLGDVPEGWTIPKLSLLTSHIGDGLHGTPKYVENSMFSFINGNNLVNGKIQFKSTTKCVSEEEYIKYKKPLTFTTLLLSINGTIGNMAFYNHEKIMLGKSSAYINCTNKILREYLYYFLQSSSNKQYFTLELTGTTIFNLSLETIRNTPIPLPPLKDQQKIANHLDQKTKQIDTLIEKSTKAIELLKERRVALVSAVVTGKVDVRDLDIIHEK